MKLCGACKRELPLDMFGRDARTPSGLNYACRGCLKTQRIGRRTENAARSKAWREANREQFLKNMRAWGERNAERKRAYKEENKERLAAKRRERRAVRADVIRAQKRDWARRNPDSVKATNRKQYEKNPDRIKANVRAWIAANPARNRLNKNLNYQKRRAAGDVTKRQWLEICLFYGNACALCKTIERPTTIDHFIPIAKGGTNTPDNVWPLCLTCNQRKHARLPDITAPPHVAVLLATAAHQGGLA